MHTRLGWLAAFILTSAILVAADTPLKQKSPKVVGKSGPLVLLFAGGRPWQGHQVRDLLVASGARVRGLVGEYLAGYSGASIKRHMGDKVEPTPFDGITPAFKILKSHKLVIFNHITPENLRAILTPERAKMLQEYVENGGHVLFTINTPSDLLPEIMPIVQSDDLQEVDETMFATRPAGDEFAIFTEKLPVFERCRFVAAKPDAEVLSVIKSADGTDFVPYLVRRQVGKGTVSFLNAEYISPHRIRQFANWAYACSFISAVAAKCGELKLDPQKILVRYETPPARREIEQTSVRIAEPKLQISDASGNAQIFERSVRFGDGAKLDVNPDGSVDLTFPGKDQPYIRNFAIPTVAFSEIKVATDNLSYEADDLTKVVKAADIKWKFDRITQEGGVVTLHYTAPESKLQWQFKVGKLELDGREYAGIAERAIVLECPLFINQLAFSAQLQLPDARYARRFDAYSPPRGYTEFPMDGSVKLADTHTWNFFGSGQPFELIACRDGVYLAAAESARATSAQLVRDQTEKFIRERRLNDVGRVKAPVETNFYWHFFSDGAERGNQEYLAMYQLLRQLYRRQNELRELPVYPVVWYSHQLSGAEKERVERYAGECGFRFIYPLHPESSINSINGERNLEIYRRIAAAGVGTLIWTAGSYTQGKNGWLIKEHPDWFCKNPDGTIFAYPGNYPVIDLHNADFYQWYCQVLKEAINAGVKWVYRDMDGAAAAVVNYALPQSPNGLAEQIKFYKFFHDHDCRVSIEGANPLVIDQYWYRPAKYTSFNGKEFALVGALPYGDVDGGLMLDYFRTGMYGTFVAFEFAGTTFGLDRVVGEVDRGKRAIALAPKFNGALDFVGMPYVRETDFGTVWYGKGGAVMFFWDPVKKLTLDLPQGWKIRGVEGNVLTDLPGDSIIYIDRQ